MNLKALKKSFQLKEGLMLSSLSVAELDAEHAQKVLDMEHTQQMKLKERQKFFEEAFQQDMEQYLSTGYLQIAERRGKCLYFPISLESCHILRMDDEAEFCMYCFPSWIWQHTNFFNIFMFSLVFRELRVALHFQESPIQAMSTETLLDLIV